MLDRANFRHIPYTLLLDNEASLMDIAVFITLVKDINFKSRKVTTTRKEICERLGCKLLTVRKSMTFLQQKKYLSFSGEIGKNYTTTIPKPSNNFVAYIVSNYDLVSGTDASIYAKMLMFGGKEKIVYGSMRKLSDKLNVTFRTLKTCLFDLQGKGLIMQEKQGIRITGDTVDLGQEEVVNYNSSEPEAPKPNLFVATPDKEEEKQRTKSEWAAYFKKLRAKRGTYFTNKEDGEILISICNEIGTTKLEKVIEMFLSSDVPVQYLNVYSLNKMHLNKILVAMDAGDISYRQNKKCTSTVIKPDETQPCNVEDVQQKINKIFG